MTKGPALAELLGRRAALEPEDEDRIQRLLGSWQLISDLCFADLHLWCRQKGSSELLCVGQIRPHTAQTLYPEDAVGQVASKEQVPHLSEIFDSKSLNRPALPDGAGLITEGIVVPGAHGPIAVMTKTNATSKERRPGRLERNYLECGACLVKMVEQGFFPFDDELSQALGPRVGDGMIRVSEAGSVLYASPNAISACRRLGIQSNLEGGTLDDVGLESASLRIALELGLAAAGDTEAGGTVVLQRAVPLLEGPARSVTGAILLVRDVSDLRYRDRQLEHKETVISEIHHRVKNNLQIIGSLLRLQGRRVSPEAKRELEEAERRIASIALVHETLSGQFSESVDFGEVAARLVQMVTSALTNRERRISIKVAGEPGRLPAEMATPLAIVLVELLTNAVEHAFEEKGGVVVVRMTRQGERLEMFVSDNGQGLDDDFSMEHAGLGLQIVKTLVESELKGTISIEKFRGAQARISIPLNRASRPEKT